MPSFAELGVSAPIVGALAKNDIYEPFPIQALVIADATAGRDVLAKSRTGSGKTLAFAIPIVQTIDPRERGPVALVLVPTRELAVQVTEEFKTIGHSHGIRVAAVYGGVSLEKQATTARKAHVIVATPGRLDDLEHRRLLSLKNMRILVLDEADRMLDMGFRPQVDRIVTRLPRQRQTLFFSATLDGPVRMMASSYTSDPVTHEVVTEEAALPQSAHRFISVSEDNKLDKLIEVLDGERSLALIFVRTKRGADRLGYKLRSRGKPALVLHGDMTQSAREKTLARFAQGRSDVLVATDVAARGIHLDDISHVVNYDPPNGKDDYVHRTGRTARAGRGGTAVTFVPLLKQREIGMIASELNLKTQFEAEGLTMPRPARVYSSHGRRGRRGPRR